MSKYHTIRILRAELDKVNQEIDLRIIKGVSYAREARRHKFLLSQLRRLRPSPLRWLLGPFSFV